MLELVLKGTSQVKLQSNFHLLNKIFEHIVQTVEALIECKESGKYYYYSLHMHIFKITCNIHFSLLLLILEFLLRLATK